MIRSFYLTLAVSILASFARYACAQEAGSSSPEESEVTHRRVEWAPSFANALELAAAEDKPIFLYVGY